jgi:hypothetical protein
VQRRSEAGRTAAGAAAATGQERERNDWIPDDPITIATKALLPEWVRWHGEQAGLPTHLLDRGIAVATGSARAAPDCAGHRV